MVDNVVMTSCSKVECFSLKVISLWQILKLMTMMGSFLRTRSKRFETEKSKVLGLWLAGILWSLSALEIVIIMSDFHAVGKYPRHRQPFKILVSNSIIFRGRFFRAAFVIESGRKLYDFVSV